MNRQDFNDLLAFMAVAREQSFTKAAAKLGTSQSTLSHTIKQLESRMGIRLLMRTTRNVSPTEAGERLLRTLVPHVTDIEQAINALLELRDKPAGSVRITLSDHALEWIVWPKLKPVLQEYPDVHIEFSVDNGFRNIVEGQFDAGVRLGESLDRDMVAVRISPDWRMVAVASPQYLSARSAVSTPQDLVHHSCMNHRHTGSGALYAWEFEKDGHQLRAKVDGQLTFNSSLTMVDAAVAGLGIAFVPENLVEGRLQTGELSLILDDWCPFFSGYHLYYPSRRQHSPAFTLVLDALRQRSSD